MKLHWNQLASFKGIRRRASLLSGGQPVQQAWARLEEPSLRLVFDVQSILGFQCPNSEGGKLEMGIFPLADILNSAPHVIAKRSCSAKENSAQWKRDRHGEGNPRQLGL